MKEPKTNTEEMVVVHESGEEFRADEGSVVKNCSAIAKRLKNAGPLVAVRLFQRSDVAEFLAAYKNGRATSEKRKAYLTRKFNNGTYIKNYPVLFWDTNGDPVNGGHNGESLMDSTLECAHLCFVLGVDPAIKTEIDVNNPRTMIQQANYIKALNDDLPKDLRPSFAAALKCIFEHYCRVFPNYVTGLAPSIAKDHIVALPEGRVFWQAAKPHFIDVLKRLDSCGNEVFKKAHFFVPAVLLSLSGHKKVAHALASGVGINEASLLARCRNYLLTNCTPNRPDFRDARVIKDVVENTFAFLYAEVTGEEHVQPLVKKKMVKRGAEAGTFKDIQHSSKLRKVDAAHRKMVVEHFVGAIQL